jgi:hypothetical protein
VIGVGPFLLDVKVNARLHRLLAWTTNVWVAQVICKLLNEHEELLTAESDP